MVLVAPSAFADEALRLPVPPEPPTTVAACNQLYAEYRVLIDDLRDQAEACNASRAEYIQERYGHFSGEGECARRIIGRCKSLVELCSAVRGTGLAALEQCQKAIKSE
jgi:hypothetical protein